MYAKGINFLITVIATSLCSLQHYNLNKLLTILILINKPKEMNRNGLSKPQLISEAHRIRGQFPELRHTDGVVSHLQHCCENSSPRVICLPLLQVISGRMSEM